MIDFKNADCIAGLKEYPDKYFDLAIVDPPYGDGQGGSGGTCYGGMFNKTIDGSPTRTKRQKAEQEKYYNRFGQRFDRYKRDKEKPVERRGGQWASKYENHIIEWDVAPPQEYFDELFRVSKNQIIWGGNYFSLPPTRCFIVWRKVQIPVSGFSMAPVEYAWTSFNRNAVFLEANSQGTKAEPRFHPTQKPIKLYEDVLEQFANKGDLILDTHVGSASSLIACYRMGFDVVGFEIDEDYYAKAKNRLDEEMAQLRFF